MKAIDINQCPELFKSRDKSLFIKKIDIEDKQELSAIKHMSLVTKEARQDISIKIKSCEHSVKEVSFSADYGAKHQKKLKQLQKMHSYQEKAIAKLRSKSLTYLSELKKLNGNNSPSSVCFLKYNTQMKSIDNSIKKSSIVFKVWRSSMEVKRTRAYTKAAFLIIGSSLAFLFLHTPMIITKVYHLFSRSCQNQTPNSTNSQASYLEVDDSKLLIEIGERISYCLYYLNFVSNLFFYSLRGPRRRSSQKNINSTVSNFTFRKINRTGLMKKYRTR
jgi:hypothetical protein